MNSGAEIEARVRDLIGRELHVDSRSLDRGTRFVDDLGASSLAVVELTIALEETFDIEIPDDEADRIRTVRDAVAVVEKQVRARQGEPRSGPAS